MMSGRPGGAPLRTPQMVGKHGGFDIFTRTYGRTFYAVRRGNVNVRTGEYDSMLDLIRYLKAGDA